MTEGPKTSEHAASVLSVKVLGDTCGGECRKSFACVFRAQLMKKLVASIHRLPLIVHKGSWGGQLGQIPAVNGREQGTP